jgi:hypothetical protein
MLMGGEGRAGECAPVCVFVNVSVCLPVGLHFFRVFFV